MLEAVAALLKTIFTHRQATVAVVEAVDLADMAQPLLLLLVM
jgi:hypothetical protein